MHALFPAAHYFETGENEGILRIHRLASIKFNARRIEIQTYF
jgi:hypothetical protein